MSDDKDIGILSEPVPFGKYYLLERISVGGMAEIYKAKAFGVEGFERVLAVKKILSNIAEDESFIEMFVDEAKIAGQLNHPNIAQIYDLGKVDDAYYIALEYISGKDLKTIFERSRRVGESVDIPQICYVCKKVCEGLDHAHEKTNSQGEPLNIVHRDVSPQNILISYEGEVKIIDFGIAKAQGKTSQTQVGVLKGKFSYMSPEQVRGLQVDHRSDLFSLGIVLYEMLTLERLFLGESDFDTLEKIRKVEMSPPSLYNPNIPDQLEDIVLKALAKDPDDRFQSAAEMAQALERFMRDQDYYYGNKELGAFMKETFEDDLEFERQKLEYFRDLELEPPDQAGEVEDVDDAGEEEGTEDEGLVWDQDEMETEIFDRSDDRPEGLPPEPVLPEPGGEPGAEGEGAVEVVGPDDQVDVIEKDDGQGAVAEPGAPVGAADAASSAESTPAADTPAGGAQPPPTPEGVAEVESGGGTARVDRRTSEQVPEAEPRQPAAKKADETGGDDGAFWTYLTAGMALLAVAAFAWVGVRVLSGPGPNETSVTFDTTPSSVTITVDGKRVYRGTTPYTHVFEPGDDPTEIAVKKEGYRTKREVRTFRTDQRYKVDWELTEKPDETQKRVASLKVKTEPPGASVRVDGEVREGKTPVTIGELEPGNHDVQVSLEGWESRERSVDVRVDEEKTLSLELKPTAVSLEVDSEPQGAYFSVYTQADDERVGSGQTPATVEKLEPGASYRVVVERDGYQRWTETVELDAESASAEVTADLQKREEPEPVASAETTSESSESPSESSGSTSPSDEGGRRSKSNDGVSGGPSEETGSTAGGSPGGETSTSGEDESSATASASETTQIPGGESAGTGGGDGGEKDKPSGTGGGGEKTDEPSTEKTAEKSVLNINSMPAARVEIDGKDTGKYTPVLNYEVEPGSHRIRLINEEIGFEKTYSVELKPGESKKIIHRK